MKSLPFRVGERLTYVASWAGLPAGEAVIEVLPSVPWGRGRACHFAMRITTSTQVDPIYRVRERQDSYTDEYVSRSLSYVKKSTGAHPRDIRVDFDWKAATATYVNAGKRKKPIAILPGTVDPLSLIFVIRRNKLAVGRVLEIPITDGKKCVVAKAVVSGQEKLIMRGKPVDTYVVLPDMGRLGHATDKGNNAAMKIWFTSDEKRLPVKIQSRFPVGNFVFQLTKVDSP